MTAKELARLARLKLIKYFYISPHSGLPNEVLDAKVSESVAMFKIRDANGVIGIEQWPSEREMNVHFLETRQFASVRTPV